MLRLEDVHKTFDNKVAVDNLSMEVPQGVLYGIIGPNGAGKTTTIRMIMNITAPDSGRVLLNDRPVGRDFTDRVGYLPEERGLYKKMTVIDVMLFLAELKGRSAREVTGPAEQWLERMNLLDYRDRKVEELSKGMQQKLQFVTTILHDPELIILDELFSGLDPINIELIKNILLELKRAGKTILFSTHVMEQAEKLCDHICMISNGRKVLDGSLSGVKQRFGKNSIQVDFEGDGAFVASLPGVKDVDEFGNYVELDLTDDASPGEILRALAEKVTVRRFEIVEPSLYNIFLDMADVTPEDLAEGKEGGGNV